MARAVIWGGAGLVVVVATAIMFFIAGPLAGIVQILTFVGLCAGIIAQRALKGLAEERSFQATRHAVMAIGATTAWMSLLLYLSAGKPADVLATVGASVLFVLGLIARPTAQHSLPVAEVDRYDAVP